MEDVKNLKKMPTLFKDGSLFNYWQTPMAGIMQWSNLPMLVITLSMHTVPCIQFTAVPIC